MPTINIKDIPEPKAGRVVDLSEDSINEIAEAVIRMMLTTEVELVQHGQWLKNGDKQWDIFCECSVCHHEGNISGHDNYCWFCGARMDEVKV